MINQNQLKELIHYDEITGVLTSLQDRPRCPTGSVLGSNNGRGYLRLMLCNRKYYAHRLAWLYVYGVWPDEIDHINHVKTDNRIINLRSASRVDNNKNASKRADNKSNVSGVHWKNSIKRWVAQIRRDPENRHLGSFSDKFEAICCRKSAENKYKYHENHGR